jgi:hypothetical protein
MSGKRLGVKCVNVTNNVPLLLNFATVGDVIATSLYLVV